MEYVWRTDEPPKKEREYLVTTCSGYLELATWCRCKYPSNNEDWYWLTSSPYTDILAWTETPEPYIPEVTKEGEWVVDDQYHLDNTIFIQCSECGQGMVHARGKEEYPNYCCNCGLKMKPPKEDREDNE